MTAVLWVVLPVLVAVGSALIAVFIMQERMKVMTARERQSLAEARAVLESQKEALDELKRLREERDEQRLLDAFLKEIRTEQRRFVREHKMLFDSRKRLVVQERVFFRHIPLCNWVEHEIPLEEGADLEALARRISAFSTDRLPVGPTPEPAAGQARAANLLG